MARIAELEAELARAEKRASSHVVKALRAGELENEVHELQQKIQRLEARAKGMAEVRARQVALMVLTVIAVVGAVIGLILRR